MKKILSFTAATLIAATALTACSSSSNKGASSEASSASPSASSVEASGDSFSKDFTSTAACTTSKGKDNELVSEVKLTGGDKKYTATYSFKNSSASAADYENLIGQVVLVGAGGTSSNTINFTFANGTPAQSEVEGLEVSFKDGKLTVSQPFTSFEKAVSLPMTWFATLSNGREKIVQCGVYGDSVTVK